MKIFSLNTPWLSSIVSLTRYMLDPLFLIAYCMCCKMAISRSHPLQCNAIDGAVHRDRTMLEYDTRAFCKPSSRSQTKWSQSIVVQGVFVGAMLEEYASDFCATL